MKKINLFNRNTNLPSYRRRGLPFPWERGPAEQPEGMGITPSPLSPTKFLKFCGTRFGATPSWKEGERKVPSFRGTGPHKNVQHFCGWFHAESPRCCRESVCGKTDGIPLFSGMTAVIFALFVATPSFAEPTELDKKTVASKAYVDTKQDIIEAGLVSLGDDWFENLPSVVSFDSTSGLVGNKYGILDLNGSMDYIDDGWQNDVGDSEVEYLIPTVGAVARELQYLFNHLDWAPLPWSVYINGTTHDDGANRINAINAYNTTFGTGTNQWAGTSTALINGQFLANSLALKQNKITTGLVEFNNHIVLPAITTYDSTSGLVANKIGILDQETIVDDEGDLSIYGLSIGYGSEMDNFVPTVRAVAKALLNRQEILSAAWTSTTSAVVMASTGGQTIDLTTSAGVVGRRYITAGGSQPLTKKSGADNVILYINGTKTLAQYQTSNFGGTGTIVENYIKNALVSLELLKDVYSELNAKITNNALPTGTTGTVVTYNGVNAETGVQEFGERAVYDPTNTYNAQNDATKLATAGFVETKQNKMVCAGWDSDTHTDEHCWLWSIE